MKDKHVIDSDPKVALIIGKFSKKVWPILPIFLYFEKLECYGKKTYSSNPPFLAIRAGLRAVQGELG